MGEEDKEALRQKLAMKLERLRQRMEAEIKEGKRKPPEAQR